MARGADSSDERLIGRRRLLRMGAAAGGTLAGFWVLVRASGYFVPDEVRQRLEQLSPWQYAVCHAFGECVLSPVSADVGLFVDGYIADLAADDRRDLLRFVGYLEHLAPFTSGKLRRFTELDMAAQSDVLAGLERSHAGVLRAGFEALKALAYMSYYRQPESWQAIGYSGPLVNFDNP